MHSVVYLVEDAVLDGRLLLHLLHHLHKQLKSKASDPRSARWPATVVTDVQPADNLL